VVGRPKARNDNIRVRKFGCKRRSSFLKKTLNFTELPKRKVLDDVNGRRENAEGD